MRQRAAPGRLGQISYAMMTLAPGTYTLSFDLIGSQRGLTTSTTVMLGSLFMALSIVFPIMRSSKKNSRIAREEERTRNTQTRGWIEPKTGCGQTAKGRLVVLRSLTWIPAQEGARTLPAECNSCARANC